MAWDILLVLTSVAGNLCNKCPNSYSNKTAVKVILSMRSLVSIEQQSPRRPCDMYELCIFNNIFQWRNFFPRMEIGNYPSYRIIRGWITTVRPVLSFQYFKTISESKRNNLSKYQGVKEFHMLARICCYCKIMVFSPFKIKSHILSLIKA